MLNVKAWGVVSELQSSITATDTKIKLPSGDGLKFKVPSTDHFYITVKNGGVREFMKVTSVVGDTLMVERAKDGTSAVSFAKGSCVKVEWNPAQLCEYVQNCTNKETTTSIEPQTICFSCETCIEIDEGGHVISVNGSTKC